MTRTEAYQEVLRLTQELSKARTRLKDAQTQSRVYGTFLPPKQFGEIWTNIHRLEAAIVAARLQLSTAEETAAERFVAIIRAEHPAVFALIADRAGLEA
jgi:hypothetical protein